MEDKSNYISRISSKVESKSIRIVGIDQLRYFLALYVFFTHGGRPPFFHIGVNEIGASSSLVLINHFYGWCINGQAAVIAFFIISGFCIHFPNVSKKRVDWKSFFVARIIRLVLPLLACLLIAHILGYQHKTGLLKVVPIWTLYCEFFYYAQYPITLYVATNKLLKYFLYGTFTLSFVLTFAWISPTAMYFHEIGGEGWLNWKAAVIAFPCWLLGVLLAENISFFTKNQGYERIQITHVYAYRLAVFLFSITTFPIYRFFLKYNLDSKNVYISYFSSSQVSLLCFSILAYFWIKNEIIYYNFTTNRKVSSLFEKLGKASFSLYLIHTLVLWFYESIIKDSTFNIWILWGFLVLVVHLVMYCFYFLVENPLHTFAKYLSSMIRKSS